MELPLLDSSTVVELREVMGDSFPLLCQRFAADGEDHLAAMSSALVQKDAESLRRQAHSLKGASINVGAVRLSDHCVTMEQLASGTDWASAKALLADIRHCLAEVVTALLASE
jgi:HPt (histidine-containing phosphotransfer) domain-containing protein